MILDFKPAACSKIILVPFFLTIFGFLTGQTTQFLDFRNYDAQQLNDDGDFLRATFEMPESRLQGGPEGVTLSIDVTDPGPYNYSYRSELREQNINTYPPLNSTIVYHVQFKVNILPDIYGPITIFQRFNRDNDGPDIEVELTGKNQFSNAVPNDLQVVAFGQRFRLGKFLKSVNDMKIIVYSAQNGKYKVSLNGETLIERTNVNTRPATDGTWSQFGLYPHGLHSNNNRQDQVNSGFSKVSFTYFFYSKTLLPFEANLDDFTTENLSNEPGPGPGPGPEPPSPDTCSGQAPQNWDLGDIGNPAIPGQACQVDSVVEIMAAGADIWDTKDEFYFLHQTLSGDVEMTAKILAIDNSHFWAKAGVMIRSELNGEATNAYMCLTQQGRWSFQRRTTVSDSTRSTRSEPNVISTPHFVKISRKGNRFYGYYGADGQNWTLADSIDIQMAAQVHVGLAATSHDVNLINRTQFTSISINNVPIGPPNSCVNPEGWEGINLGNVALAGNACIQNDQLVVSASGSDIWGNEDEFFYLYQPIVGNWEVSARILDIGDSDDWAKAGLMIRDGLSADAKNAFVSSSSGQKWSFQQRAQKAAATTGTISPATTYSYPHWLKLVRQNETFSGYYSLDGTTWELISTVDIEMSEELLIGIAATSHNNNILNGAKFDQLNYKEISTPNTLPVEFVDFYGKKHPSESKIDLFWEVGLEQGNDYFTVERSTDGLLFEQVGTVESLGNTVQRRTYTFSDRNPIRDKNFYRIRQTDIDGHFTYSATIQLSVDLDSKRFLSVYPVPVNAGEPVQVDVILNSDSQGHLQLRDLMGRTIKHTSTVTGNQVSIEMDTTGLLPGLYYVLLLDPQGIERPVSQKVYIQN